MTFSSHTTVHIFQQTLCGCGIINIGRCATLVQPLLSWEDYLHMSFSGQPKEQKELQ